MSSELLESVREGLCDEPLCECNIRSETLPESSEVDVPVEDSLPRDRLDFFIEREALRRGLAVLRENMIPG